MKKEAAYSPETSQKKTVPNINSKYEAQTALFKDPVRSSVAA